MDIGDERQKVVALMTAILLSGKTVGAGAKGQKDIDNAVETAHRIWSSVKWHETEAVKKLAASANR
jgi:TATA-box binding protein (TBP) (component of TFIID and TFIIIB)